MGLGPAHRDECGCDPEPFAVTLSEAKGLQFAQGELREGSAVPLRGELMQILRFAQNDAHGRFFRSFRGAGSRLILVKEFALDIGPEFLYFVGEGISPELRHPDVGSIRGIAVCGRMIGDGEGCRHCATGPLGIVEL